MLDKLVTIATFGTPTEASIVRNRLDAEGIRAFLTDEVTVGMAWHLGTAIGGIKLQVAEDDVERAIAAVEANDPAPITEADWQSDEADDTSEADADDVEEDQAISPADEIIARAFRAAVFGLLLFPLQLYSLWLLVRIAFDTAPLSPANRRRVLITLILDLPIIVICSVLLWSMFAG